MRNVILIVIVTLFAQNAFAETAGTPAPTAPTTSPTEPTPPPDSQGQQCPQNGNGNDCCADYSACQEAQAELGQETRELFDTWRNAYGETPEQAGRRLCRSIGGSWGTNFDGNDWRANCECRNSRQWDAEHKFCVPPNASYLEHLCTDSGGRWTGGNCDCQGKRLEGGRCTGQNRIEELTGQLATAQATARTLGEELQAANANLDTASATDRTQADQIDALTRQRDSLQTQLDQLTLVISGLRGLLEAEGASVPAPETTPPGTTTTETPPGAATPGEIPGAHQAAAAVAVESTQPPVGQVPPAGEEEESSCGGWCIAGIVAGALAVGLGTYLAVELSTSYHLVQ